MLLVFTLASLILFIIVLIYISGWFSGTETALTHLSSASVAEMRKNNAKNIQFIVRLKRDMDRTLITILIGNNIVNIILSAVAALVANALFQNWGVAAVVAIITILIIIFGEITPKHTAIMDSRKIASRNARAIYYLMRTLDLFRIIDIFTFISRRIIVMRRGNLESRNLLVTDETIKSLATLGEQEGVIKSIEKEIIHKVFGFGDMKTRDIMVPMKNVFSLDKNYSVRKANPIIRQHGFTRVPFIKNGKVEGIVYSKDLLGRASGKISAIARDPSFVKADSDISELFIDMKRKRIHMVIVKNCDGEHVGIVTLEDILEELVGEIHDEYFEVKYGNGDRPPEEMLEEQGVYREGPFTGEEGEAKEEDATGNIVDEK